MFLLFFIIIFIIFFIFFFIIIMHFFMWRFQIISLKVTRQARACTLWLRLISSMGVILRWTSQTLFALRTWTCLTTMMTGNANNVSWIKKSILANTRYCFSVVWIRLLRSNNQLYSMRCFRRGTCSTLCGSTMWISRHW